jgi:hypothetical protein
MASIGCMLQLGDRGLNARERQFGQRDEALGSDVVKFLGKIVVVRPHTILLQLGVILIMNASPPTPAVLGKSTCAETPSRSIARIRPSAV